MKNSILRVLYCLHLKTAEENLERGKKLMKNLTLTPLELDDETAVKSNNFLYEFLEAFETNSCHQIPSNFELESSATLERNMH